MANATFSGDFESLARQYWNTWNQLLGGRGSALDGWGLAGTMPPGLGRMDPGACDWYQRMQRLAADFSNGGKAADIASAWREMLGGQASSAEPFSSMLRSMQGGLAGDAWLDQTRPLLEMLLRPLRQQSAEWLQRPAFGPAREHQERLQALALAWQQWEEHNEAFNAILAQAGQGAFERFERLLQEHDAPGKRLESARALFDLWIDAAEEAWAEIAMSVEYRHAYAEMTNALMRLRLGLQREVEQFGSLLGLPGRSELDALHRKVAEVERALHAARRGAAKQAAPRPAAAKTAPADAGQGDAKPAAAAAKPAATARVARGGSSVRAPVAKVKTGKPKTRKPKVRKAPAAKAAKAPARKPTAGQAVPAKTPHTKAAAARSATAVEQPARPARKATAARTAAAVPAPPRKQRREVAQRVASTTAPGKRATPARVPIAAVGHAAQAPAKARKVVAVKTPAAKAAVARTRAAQGVVTKVPAKKAAAAKAPAAKTPAAKTPAARVAAGATRRASAKTTPAPASARVVSMKDWVSRNLAAAQPGASAGRKARK